MELRPSDFQEGQFPVPSSPPPPPPPTYYEPPNQFDVPSLWDLLNELAAEEPEPRRPVWTSDDEAALRSGSSTPSYFPTSYTPPPPRQDPPPAPTAPPFTFGDGVAVALAILVCVFVLFWIMGLRFQGANENSVAPVADNKPKESPNASTSGIKTAAERDSIRLNGEKQFVRKVMTQQKHSVLERWLEETPELRPLNNRLARWSWPQRVAFAGPIAEYDDSQPEPKFKGWRMSQKSETISCCSRAFLAFCLALDEEVPDPQNWDPPRRLVMQWLFFRQFVHTASAELNFNVIAPEVVDWERDRQLRKAGFYDEKLRRFRDLPWMPDRDNPPRFPRVVESLLDG